MHFRTVLSGTLALLLVSSLPSLAAPAAGQASDSGFTFHLPTLGIFGEHVGTAFQLVDDCLDYAGDPEETVKTLYADLHEGKITLPLIRALSAKAAKLEDVDQARAGDEDACMRLARAVRTSGACDGVREIARDHTGKALAALSEAAPPGSARDLLAAVARELTGRTK